MPQNREPEELLPNPEAFELAKNEANSANPPGELIASLEGKNIIESPIIPSRNTALGIAASRSQSLVGVGASIPPSLKFLSPPSFEGINSIQAGTSDPPDVALAAGNDHVIEMVNLAWRIYNKTGTSLVPGVDPWFKWLI